MKAGFWGLLFYIFCGISFALAQTEASKAPFKGEDLFTGGSRSLNPLSRKTLVLIFLSIRCPNSEAHLEEIKKMAIKFPEAAFVGIHSNQDESIAETRKYFTTHPLPFPLIQDSSLAFADRWKALKTPHAFVISSEGEVLYKGGVTDSALPRTAKKLYLQNALSDIHSGKPVQIPEGRTLGCVIARTKEAPRVW